VARPSSYPRELRERADHGVEEGERRAAPGQRDLEVGVGFLRGAARPPVSLRVDYAADHRDQFGVEPICRVLTEHGCPIAPSTFYDAVSRRPSRRALREKQIIAQIEAERAGNRFVAGLGARKMWLRLRGQGHDVARCTVERLIAQMGVTGVIRGRRPVRTTIADPDDVFEVLSRRILGPAR
jgi:hypothetical protein